MFEFFCVMFEFFIDQYFKFMNRESQDKKGKERSFQRGSPTQNGKKDAFFVYNFLMF